LILFGRRALEVREDPEVAAAALARVDLDAEHAL